MSNKNTVIKQTVRYTLGVLIGVAIMLLVYFALGKIDATVFIGAAVGSVISVGNFFFMCVSLTNATKTETEAARIVARARGGYLLRMIAVALLLVVAIKSGYCNIIATIVPLLLVRPILMRQEFFTKSGEEK